VTYTDHEFRNVVTFPQNTALSTATTFLQDSFGLPSDAVMTDVADIYSTDETTKSKALTGYEFIWHHSGNKVVGGDSIKVDITDNNYLVGTVCNNWTYPPGLGKGVCLSWTQQYADAPYVSYGYRLWRSTGAQVIESSNGRTTGGQSMDAYTASLSLPNPDGVGSYAYGYWTPNAYSSGGVAEPAWLFRLAGGQTVAIDAFDGSVLGSISE
jgi:hypothetical protein